MNWEETSGASFERKTGQIECGRVRFRCDDDRGAELGDVQPQTSSFEQVDGRFTRGEGVRLEDELGKGGVHRFLLNGLLWQRAAVGFKEQS